MTIVAAGHTDDGEGRDGDQLVAEYLRELEREAARLPWNTRMELLEDVQSHIAVALAESDGESGVREAADDSGDGDPADRVAGSDPISGTDAIPGAGATPGPEGTSPEKSSPEKAGAAKSTSEEPSGITRTARVRRILAALGEPREIVDAAAADEPQTPLPPLPPQGAESGPPYGPPYQYPQDPGPPYPLGTQEIFAILLLLVGAFFWGIGWIVGVILLWSSARWNLRERLIGTLIWPGGLGGVIIAGGLVATSGSKFCSSSSTSGIEQCTTTGDPVPGWVGVLLFLLAVIAPVLTAFYLVRAARTRPGPEPWKSRRTGNGCIGAVLVICLLFVVGGLVFSCGKSGDTRAPAVQIPSPSSPAYPIRSPGATAPPYSSSSP